MEMPPGDSGSPPHSPPRTHVAVLDEYPIILMGVTEHLEAHEGFLVVAQALSGAELIRAIDGRRLDVLVLEPWLRSGDGLEAIGHVRHTLPEVTIVAFSRVWDDHHVDPVMDMGVAAYVPKTTPPGGLCHTIANARNGMVTRPRTSDDGIGAPQLTPREVVVLRLVADGRTNGAIATELFLSERTVRFHLRNAYAKLGADNRTMAVAVARKAGIIV